MRIIVTLASAALLLLGAASGKGRAEAQTPADSALAAPPGADSAGRAAAPYP